MVVMKKRTAVAVTMGVWVAALGSAAALTYELNRPLHWAGVTSQLAARIHNTAYGAVAELQPVIYVPTVTVVGTFQNTARARGPKPAKDISKMHCAAWRELDMGSGRVQVCD